MTTPDAIAPNVAASNVVTSARDDPATERAPAFGIMPGRSSYFGWGLYGMNLPLTLSTRADFAPTVAMPFPVGDCELDPLRKDRIAALAQASSEVRALLPTLPDDRVELDAPLLTTLGRNLTGGNTVHGRTLWGRPSIGVVFVEHATIDDAGRQAADRYALIVAGSAWNEQVLRANGIVAAITVFHGVNTALFHPAPLADLYRGRFVIFPGGKLAFRKDQDLVIKALKAFHQRHPRPC